MKATGSYGIKSGKKQVLLALCLYLCSGSYYGSFSCSCSKAACNDPILVPSKTSLAMQLRYITAPFLVSENEQEDGPESQS